MMMSGLMDSLYNHFEYNEESDMKKILCTTIVLACLNYCFSYPFVLIPHKSHKPTPPGPIETVEVAEPENMKSFFFVPDCMEYWYMKMLPFTKASFQIYYHQHSDGVYHVYKVVRVPDPSLSLGRQTPTKMLLKETPESYFKKMGKIYIPQD